ncbi:MAG: hypothetical protein LBU88_08545 [Treponema sp.]|jgi:hypothetical protein|nr:hypothetical protein [Treponema sp.]
MDKKIFEKFDKENSFIRVTTGVPVEGPRKAALNRKGNQLFNSGKIEEAKRVFMTTGYSDGLSRVGDFYKSKERLVEALRMYWMAHDKNKAGHLIEHTAGFIQGLLRENTPGEG